MFNQQNKCPAYENQGHQYIDIGLCKVDSTEEKTILWECKMCRARAIFTVRGWQPVSE